MARALDAADGDRPRTTPPTTRAMRDAGDAGAPGRMAGYVPPRGPGSAGASPRPEPPCRARTPTGAEPARCAAARGGVIGAGCLLAAAALVVASGRRAAARSRRRRRRRRDARARRRLGAPARAATSCPTRSACRPTRRSPSRKPRASNWTVRCDEDSEPAGGDHRPGAARRHRGRAGLGVHDVLGSDRGLPLRPRILAAIHPHEGADHRMRLRAVTDTPASVVADVLAVPIYRDDAELAGDLAELDAASGGAIRAAIDWGEFNVARARLGARRRRRPAGRASCSSSTRGVRGRGASARAGWRRSRRAGSTVVARGRWRCGFATARMTTPGRPPPPARSRARIGRPRSTAACATPRRCAAPSTRCCSSARRRLRSIAARSSARAWPSGATWPTDRPNDLYPETDGRGRARAGGRWLHGRDPRAPGHGASSGWACSLGVGQGATHEPRLDRRQAAGLGERRRAATCDRRARACASTPVASASSRRRAWAT